MGALVRHILVIGILALLYVVVNSQGGNIFPVSCYLNVMIILDRSDSVKGGFNRSRDFVVNVSQELQVGPHKHSVSMIVYSGNSYRREIYKWNFAKSNEEFTKIVKGLRAIGGTTNTKKALELAVSLMDTRNKTIPTLIMVVTDGRSAVDPIEPAKKLQSIPNTWVFAAATGDPHLADKHELIDITGHINHVILQSCEQDLVLVMDFSSTTHPVYKEYQKMSEQMLRQLYISPRHTRVALIIFSSVGKTHTKFDLDRYDNADDIIREIKNVQYIGGTTAIGEGIKEATKQAEESHGARPKLANKIMVVFTDGWSNKGSDPEAASKQATALGFQVYPVGFVDNRPDATPVNQLTLDVIASKPSNTFTNQNFNQLINIVRQRNLKCL
ncbi:hypothetical protein FO519_002196 [Halicephalobus sp. NKZ332]|nr:hypothetical protein FO519_002196 [Halicephalobus sp. NKZ332]